MLIFVFNPIKFQNRRQKYYIFLNYANKIDFFTEKNAKKTFFSHSKPF